MTGRKGARSRAEVPPKILNALNAGREQTASLPECLAVDMAALMAACFPELDPAPLAEAAGEGITRRMAVAADLAVAKLGPAAFGRFVSHPSDTVRGWAGYVAGRLPDLSLGDRLDLVRPLADDPHFGVREWVWLGIRAHVAADPDAAIDHLAAWTSEPSLNLRRFASEATRPRGVWCAHIRSLRADPAPGLAVLEPLKADPERYVQDSVANWLNDAAKDHPDWVRTLCGRWSEGSPGRATAYILRRASRSLG